MEIPWGTISSSKTKFTQQNRIGNHVRNGKPTVKRDRPPGAKTQPSSLAGTSVSLTALANFLGAVRDVGGTGVAIQIIAALKGGEK